MKKTAFALGLVFLLLIGVPRPAASDPDSSSQVQQDNQALWASRQDVRTGLDGCPAEEAGVIAFGGDAGWRQPSLFGQAQAASLGAGPPRISSDEQPVPLTTGAWFMAVGVVVFIISRKRFRS